jgi:hypothetical protein
MSTDAAGIEITRRCAACQLAVHLPERTVCLSRLPLARRF